MCILLCGCIVGLRALFSGIRQVALRLITVMRARYEGIGVMMPLLRMGPVRENDVLVEKVPGLNQYLDWRKRIDTDAVEIFEFNIPDEQAEEIWTILRYGTKRSHPKGRFSTNAMGDCVDFRLLNFFIVLLRILLQWIRFGTRIAWQNNFITKIRTE